MKIKGTCSNCGREFLASQVVEGDGHCPWCGKAFNKDYTAVLATALREAERHGDAFQAALEQISDMEPAMALDEESVIGPLRDAVRTARRRRARV
jgi:DNA-directed RNA polymerase subunit RPC12/RpoP